MGHNLSDFRFLRRNLSFLIDLNPIHVQNWVLVAGDGFGTANSYQFSASWVGTFAHQGRQVFRDNISTTDNSGAAFKNYVIMLPYDSTKPIPTRNSMIELFDMQGNSNGRFYVLFVKTHRAATAGINEDTAWSVELNCQQYEG